jgi:hypothetical protein
MAGEGFALQEEHAQRHPVVEGDRPANARERPQRRHEHWGRHFTGCAIHVRRTRTARAHNRQYCEPFQALDQPGLTSRSVNCLG